MRNIKPIGWAFIAMLATSAVAAAPAAAALIKFTSSGVFQGKSTGSIILEISNGVAYSCQSVTIKGEITSEQKGHASILLDKCVFDGGISCHNEGASSIVIKEASILLGSDEGTSDNPAVLFKPSEEVKFECTGDFTPLTLTGSLVCLIKNQAVNRLAVSCAKGPKAGEQKDKFLWEEGVKGPENNLMLSEGEFGPDPVSWETEVVLESTNKIQVEV